MSNDTLEKVDVKSGSIQLNGEVFTLKLYDKIDPISEIWDSMINENRLFFRSKYFKILEISPPPQLNFYYCLIYKNKKLEGCLYFQIIHYNAYKSLNLDNEKARNRNSWGLSIVNASKEYVAKSLDFKGIIFGNSLTTGQNAYQFNDRFDIHDQVSLADLALEEVRTILIKNGIKVRLAFIKDFHQDIFSEPQLEKAKCEEYYRLDAQPNMFLKLHPKWKNQTDYFTAFKSKYRVGAKKALKQLVGIEKRQLTNEDVEIWNETMYKLYRYIADTASFNLFFLNKDYFKVLNREMHDECKMYGYFKDNQLIAFYTVFDLGHELDAHFLGYEMELNKELQLYKNILIDIVTLAIEQKKEKVNFSRTAMEIKSSIGAQEEDMSCYIQHRNKLQNVLYAKFFDWLKPENDWIIREPFK